ncbi:MAG: hypothetical protein IJU19_01650 [Bacteroidales bacterium]|nr:hypothetical protein [Bacteroidales bacterium]
MLTDIPTWVAVLTYPNAEQTVVNHLRKEAPDIECYLPMMANRDRRYKRHDLPEKPMFPSYLFVRINARQIYQVRTTHGVVAIVSSQHSIIPVPERDIEAVRLFEATRRQFYLAETSSLVKGSRVAILNGEFAGLEGTLIKGNRDGNFSVNITVLNLSFIVHIKRSELRPSAPATTPAP